MADAFMATCSGLLLPGMTAVTPGVRRHHASAHAAMLTPDGTSSFRMRSTSATVRRISSALLLDRWSAVAKV